jgi:hypothetical protein
MYKNKDFIEALLISVAFLVGGCGNRTASTQDAALADTILAEEVPDTVQTVSQEPSQTLPDGSVKAAEANGLFVFTKLIQKASEDNPADIKSLWLYERKTGRVDSLLTTNPFAELRWADMNGSPVEVALTQIAAADNVCFVPGHPQLLLVEGCPDARNIWTYIIDMEKKTARQFPSTEGLLSFAASGDTLVLGAYGYHEEGGRYSVARTYTLEGRLVSEVKLEE